MGLDADVVFIQDEIENLKEILHELEHGERGEFCDDLIKFVKKMKKKHLS